MAKIKTFRDIVAWQRGMALCRVIYLETQSMPADERFGLTAQMRKSAASLPSNIAEGFGREKRPDVLRHLRIARGSLNELSTQYEIAIDLKMLQHNSEVMDLLEETDRVLQAFIRSLEVLD